MRFKWFIAGAMLAAAGITGGSLWLRADQQQRLALERENVRLAEEHAALVRRAEQLAADRARLEEERKRLTQVVERLSVERRVAAVDVLQQHVDDTGQVRQTVLRLTEFDRDGEPLPSQVFGVPGRTPHFDALVIKFQDDYVANADVLRGTSLALFRRVYGETQAPEAGYWIGEKGAVPDVYRVNPEPSDFERELWREFWSYATDPAKAAEAGVRVAQGEAVYAPVTAGERWLLTLESDGGLNLTKQEGQLPDMNTLLPFARAITLPPADADRKLHAPPPLGGDT